MGEEIDMSSFLKNTPTTVSVKAVFQLSFFENRISHSKILLLRNRNFFKLCIEYEINSFIEVILQRVFLKQYCLYEYQHREDIPKSLLVGRM